MTYMAGDYAKSRGLGAVDPLNSTYMLPDSQTYLGAKVQLAY